MNLQPEPELVEFAAGVRKLLESAPLSESRARWDDPAAYDERTWRSLTQEMGAAALGRAEAEPDAPFLAQAVVFEQLGYALHTSPYFASVGLVAPILATAGTLEAIELLDRIESGESAAALAIADDLARWNPLATAVRAEHADGGFRLHGTKSFVVDAAVADVLVVTATDEDRLRLFAVDPADAQIEPLRALDLTRWLARVVLDGAPGTPLSDAGAEPIVRAALDRSGTLLAAETVGLAQRCLDMSVEYAKVRVQSGRPIGSFQAIKHKLADMLSAIEGARAAVYFAASVADERPEHFPAAASIAQAVAADAGVFVASENIQVHGGIGFTWEHDAHLFYRRAQSSAQLLGRSADHRRALKDRLHFEEAS